MVCNSFVSIFTVGYVHSGSTKCIVSAVGEGTIVVSDIYKFLALKSQSKSVK